MEKQVSVEVSGIEFSAGHFVSEGGKCESLHGHNYQVAVRIIGEVDDKGMVIDFRIMKKNLRDICKRWDHRILLPARSQQIKVISKEEQTQVITPDRKYSFPTSDVIVLDVIETTAEELARVLCQYLLGILKDKYPNISEIRLSIAESPTSTATVSVAV